MIFLFSRVLTKENARPPQKSISILLKLIKHISLFRLISCFKYFIKINDFKKRNGREFIKLKDNFHQTFYYLLNRIV